MCIPAVSNPLASPTASTPTRSLPTATFDAAPPSTAADTATISTTARQAADAAFAAFQTSLRAVQDQLNGYEHQVYWQLAHDVPVTGPKGTPTANTSTGAATSAIAVGELTNNQHADALQSAVSVRIGGNLGLTELAFASGTALSAVAFGINNVKSVTGVSASVSGTSFKFNPTGSGSNQFVTVSSSYAPFPTTANTKAAATTETVANGFAAIDFNLAIPYDGLSGDQQNQANQELQQLRLQQTKFDTYVADQTTPNYAAVTGQLGKAVNDFEHQALWQIEHGVPVTAPIRTHGLNTSTGTTTGTAGDGSTGSPSNAIASGFASLEAAAAKQLGSLSSVQAAAFKKLEQSLSAEQARFTANAEARAAYQSTPAKAGAVADVAA